VPASIARRFGALRFGALRFGALVAALVALAAHPATAEPAPTDAPAPTAPQRAADLGRRLAIGMQFGALDRPAGHLGIPLDGDGKMGAHLSFAFVGRYQLDERTALAAGFGLPTGAMGFAIWSGYEVALPVAHRGPGIAAIEVYEASGLQFGFAGPDYFARHDNEYVGFGYGYNPPFAFGVRLPVGLRIRWRGDRFDTHIEGTEILVLAPSVESNFELAVGASLHFQ
jgi:hypothetical protein